MLKYQLKNLSYEYKLGNNSVKILDNINLEIESGDLVIITGPSGSGKSTLLYILGCILKPQNGEVWLENQNVTTLSDLQLACFRNYKIGFIFQQFFLLPKMNVLDNILLPSNYPLEISLNETLEENNLNKAIQIAKKLGLTNRLSHFPKELSGGEQQRVAIARALIRSGNIIIADEPTGSLDTKNSKLIIDTLLALNEEGYTVIIVTHDLSIAQKATKHIIIKEGKIEKITSYKEKPPTFKFDKDKKSFDLPDNININPYSLIKKLLAITGHNIFLDKVKLFSNILGIIIGIANIITMITLGQFLKEKVLTSYSELGADILSIYGYPNWNMRAEDKSKITFESFSMDNDLKPLQYTFPEISKISPLIKNYILMPVSFGAKNLKLENAQIIGVSKEYFEITGKKFDKGDSNLLAFDHYNSSCLIDHEIFTELFSISINPIGKILKIGKDKDVFTCNVIGVLSKTHKENGAQTPSIYLPYNYFIKVHDNIWLKEIHSFLLTKESKIEIVLLGHAIEKYFQLKYGNTGRFFIDSNIILVNQMSKFMNLSTIILIMISIISLIVGGIGIVNMMLVSVEQRIKEIGIRKAIGATNFSIKIQILWETIYICLIGGIIGTLMGFVFYELVIFIASKFINSIRFELVFSIPAILFALCSLIITSIIAGIIPAIKTESIDIITALKAE